VKTWFQAFAFKCNLHRYVAASIGDAIFVADVDTKAGAVAKVVTVDLTQPSSEAGIAVVSQLKARPGVVDMAVSLAGGRLAVGHADGTVGLYNLNAVDP
jgi:hypothetical protein